MTTYPLAFPSIVAPKLFSLRGHNVVGMTAAPMSGVQQTQEFQGKWWLGEWTWPIMTRATADICQAFLDDLNGMQGTFLMGNPKARLSKGSAAVTPGTLEVDGAGQTGTSLLISTGLGTVAGYMKAGDMFHYGTGVNTHLHRLTADLNLISGAGTVHFWPRLRSVPADNEDLVIVNPVGHFRLSMNEVGGDTDEAGNVTIPNIAFREAF